MRSLSLRMLLSIGGIALLAGTAAPASAMGRVVGATPVPACTIGTPHLLVGAQFINGTTLNGTWSYAVGVACTSNVADFALYAQLDHNGTKVDSHLKGFTGVPRQIDAEGYFHVFCARCSGRWTFTFGEILRAPAGVHWVSSPGCVAVSDGMYLLCVQQQSEVLP